MVDSTVLAIGGVTVSSSGSDAGGVLKSLQTLLANPSFIDVNYAGGTVPTVSPADFGHAVLIVNSSVGGAISLPAGYGAVIVADGSNVSLTGGGATTTIVGGTGGTFSYSGDAGVVATSGDNISVTDGAVGAIIEIGGGTGSVFGNGNQQDIKIAGGAHVTTALTGTGDFVEVGNTKVSAAIPAGAGSVPAPTSVAAITAQVINVQGGSNIIDLQIGASTVNLTAGSTTVFAGSAGDIMFGGAGSVFFIGGNSVSTVFGGSANDVVNGNHGGVEYHEGTGSFSQFIGADSTSATSTIYGGGSGAYFGGGHGDAYYLGSGTNVYVAGSGSDTLFAGTAPPTIFGSAASGFDVSLVGTGATGLTQVVMGQGAGTINASLTGGTNAFFDQVGDNTLVGGSGTNLFNVYFDASGSHNITIENWNGSDAVFLSGFNAASVAAAGSALASGAHSVHLADNTTITFVGAHPIASSGTVLFGG